MAVGALDAHTHMAHAEGKALVNIMVVYGIARQAGANKRL